MRSLWVSIEGGWVGRGRERGEHGGDGVRSDDEEAEGGEGGGPYVDLVRVLVVHFVRGGHRVRVEVVGGG